jgi:hypothetical protein
MIPWGRKWVPAVPAEQTPTIGAMPKEAPRWNELYRRLPPELRSYQLELAWSRETLWALDLPVEEMPVPELVWQLSLPWWRDGERYFVLRPTDVLEAPERYPEQHARTLAADLACPIDITLRQGRWFVLDGVHRLLKAVLVGARTISVRKLNAADLDRIAASERARGAA